MEKLNLQDDRYILCIAKHGDTAYVSLKDIQEGVIYEVDDIKLKDFLNVIMPLEEE